MNLWTRARSPRTAARFSLPAEYDHLANIFNLSGRPINGEFEVSSTNLDSITERVYKQSGPVFALIAIRMLLFSEARFQFQRMTNGRPAGLYGTPALKLLERPWPGGTTGDLLARCEQDVSLMGNAFVTDRIDGRLRRLRPDWVTLVYGSETEPELAGDALDGELLAYIYAPRMPGSMGTTDHQGTILLPHEVAHYAPYPDPQAQHRGMSWLTPVIREVAADEAALIHKDSFFRNGASPRLAMKIDPSIEKEDFERLVAMIESAHAGPFNAYKTLYLGGGADPLPLTVNLKDLDYKAVTGGGETRLASAAGVPPVIVGFSEGLAGSSLNAGNYQQAKRRLGDGTLRPLWRNFAGSMETLFPPPSDDSRLWYDDRDIAFLRDDESDAAEIGAQHATTIRTLVDAGFEPESAVAAVAAGDFSGLKHTGLFSVQLQPPGTTSATPGELSEPTDPAPPGKPAPPADPAAEAENGQTK